MMYETMASSLIMGLLGCFDVEWVYGPDESAINLDHIHVCFRPCVHLPRGYLVDSDCIHQLVLKANLIPTLQCKATELLHAPIDSNISLRGMHQISVVIITV